MQVNGRMGRVLVIRGAAQVSSVVWVGKRQLDLRTGEVVLMKGEVWVSSTI